MEGRASALALFVVAATGASFMACIDRLDEDPVYLDAGHVSFDAAPHDGALTTDGSQDANNDSAVIADASHDGAVGDAASGDSSVGNDASGVDASLDASVDAASFDAAFDAPSLDSASFDAPVFDAPVFDVAPIDAFVPPDGGIPDAFIFDATID